MLIIILHIYTTVKTQKCNVMVSSNHGVKYSVRGVVNILLLIVSQ